MRGLRAMPAPAAAIVVAGAALLGGCGGNQKQDRDEKSGTYTLEVVNASFPAKQRLADKVLLSITVRNADSRSVPNVAVTVEGAEGAPAAEPFAEASPQPGLAGSSRPVWILDQGPQGGDTAYTNTWALGTLKPGEEKTFTWLVTAIRAGTHSIRYKLAAGLNGKAKAQLSGGQPPVGSFRTSIYGGAVKARVDEAGKVVKSPSAKTQPKPTNAVTAGQ